MSGWNANHSVWNASNNGEKSHKLTETIHKATDLDVSVGENYENLSIEELEEKLSEIKMKGKIFYNMEQSIKLMLNSMYGAFGNEWFYFYDIRIAETITIQGQDSILFTEDEINNYFWKEWHLDFETHEKMGIKVTGGVVNPAVIYIDTDSCYVSYEEAIKKSTWEGSHKDFIQKLYDVKLKPFIESKLDKYAKDRNCENFLKFEMESIAKQAIWLAKKKYIQDIVWTDPNISYESLSNIKAKGFETVMSSTSQFARDSLNKVLRFLYSKDKEDIKMEEIVKILKGIKQQFKIEDIDKITKNLRISKYKFDKEFEFDTSKKNGYILEDTKTFEIKKGCPAHVRGAGYHNYLIYNSKYNARYQRLGAGDKVKMYYTLDKNCDVFSFLPGEYPYQIAPTIDHDLQFEKNILDPINRVLKVLNLQTLDRNLIYAASLF